MESDTPPVWQTISQHWQSIGIINPPGATDADLDAFERTHGVRLPAEIREFYSHMDGMSLGEWDESLIRFCHAQSVGRIPRRTKRWNDEYGQSDARLA